jgi:hypothetical protein
MSSFVFGVGVGNLAMALFIHAATSVSRIKPTCTAEDHEISRMIGAKLGWFGLMLMAAVWKEGIFT